MSTPIKAIIAAIVIVLLLGGAYVVFLHKNTSNSNAPSTITNAANQSATGSNEPASNTAVAATITFNGNGFSPAVTIVKAGDTIKIVNSSSTPMQLDSDPHPTHTDEPELNVGEVDAGKSATFVLTKVGSWGYHDHLNPSLTGRINVQ